MLECQAMIEPQASNLGIRVTFPEFGDILVSSTPIEPRMKQVLINLLSNAIKYNSARGTVAVETVLSPTRIRRISIRDTGAGLSPEQLAQLFQPFNRLGQEAAVRKARASALSWPSAWSNGWGASSAWRAPSGEGSVFWFELDLTTTNRTLRR